MRTSLLALAARAAPAALRGVSPAAGTAALRSGCCCPTHGFGCRCLSSSVPAAYSVRCLPPPPAAAAVQGRRRRARRAPFRPAPLPAAAAPCQQQLSTLSPPLLRTPPAPAQKPQPGDADAEAGPAAQVRPHIARPALRPCRRAALDTACSKQPPAPASSQQKRHEHQPGDEDSEAGPAAPAQEAAGPGSWLHSRDVGEHACLHRDPPPVPRPRTRACRPASCGASGSWVQATAGGPWREALACASPSPGPGPRSTL